MHTEDKEQKSKLVKLVREIVSRDNQLREKFEIGDKFRFVRDRLRVLLDQLEKHLETVKVTETKTVVSAGENETLVYVYLYNSQGAQLQTWLNMLTPKLFYEYSVNRPIYTEKKHIEMLIQSKPNRVQHAFLTIAIKHDELIKNTNAPQDALGNTVMKVKEGALHFEKFITLTHNEQEYKLVEQVLVKLS